MRDPGGAYTDMAAEALVGQDETLAHLREAMPSELVSPVVLYLAHHTSSTNGITLDAGGGRVGAFFTGSTLGVFDKALPPETVAARWEEIVDRTDYAVLRDGSILIALGRRDIN
ncbi:hypothetical protein [Streptomyces sp. NPDC001275]